MERLLPIKIILSLIVCSPLMIASILHFVPSATPLLYLKDMILVILVIWAAIEVNERGKVLAGLLVPFIICFSIAVLISDSHMGLLIASLRQMIMPFLFIFIGVNLIKTQYEYDEMVCFILKLFIGVVVFGVFERITHLWSSGWLQAYFQAKSIPVLSSGYPFFFIEPVGVQELAEHSGLVRMSSVVLDPINLGHLLVACYFLSSGVKNKLIFFTSLLATLSKGALIHFFIVSVIFNKKIELYYRLLIGLASFFILLYLLSGHAGFLLHLKGLVNATANVSLFGEGVGHAGNYSVILKGINVHDVTDSFFGSVLGQLGFIGAVFWLLPLLFVAAKVWDFGLIGKVMLGQIIVSVLSENTLNFSSLIIAFFLGGALLNVKTKPVA